MDGIGKDITKLVQVGSVALLIVVFFVWHILSFVWFHSIEVPFSISVLKLLFEVFNLNLISEAIQRLRLVIYSHLGSILLLSPNNLRPTVFIFFVDPNQILNRLNIKRRLMAN